MQQMLLLPTFLWRLFCLPQSEQQMNVARSNSRQIKRQVLQSDTIYPVMVTKEVHHSTINACHLWSWLHVNHYDANRTCRIVVRMPDQGSFLSD